MFSSFISHFFNKNKNSLKVPDSILVKKVQECADENALYVFKDAKIFHHTHILEIPLLIVDPKRGIYIFEYKTWSYNEIKNLKVSKSTHENSSESSLAFETKHDYIKKRFSEVLNNDGVEIFNFVLMENISKQEFERLDDSFSEFIPQSKTLFSSDTNHEIKEKLFSTSDEKNDILDVNSVISTLFVQNTIIDADDTVKITSDTQNNIIYHNFSGVNYISCKNNSGKTTTILLKAIYEHLQNKDKNIYIIEPTNIACELLKQKLLSTVEHSIVEVNFSKISIMTPNDFKNKKAYLILVDSSFLMSENFMNQIISNNKDTIIFEDHDASKIYEFSLNDTYKKDAFVETLYGNPYAIAFVNIQRLINQNIDSKDILIIAKDKEDEDKILEDLCQFIEKSTIILNPSESLNTQELDHVLIAKYNEVFGLTRDYVFLFDPKDIEDNIYNFIVSRANKKTFVIYDEDSNIMPKNGE